MHVPFLEPPLTRRPPGELPELMDRPDCDAAELRRALHAIDTAGRATGRDRILARQAGAVLRDLSPGSLSLLDVGAGSGHASLRLASRLAALGWRPKLVLADLHAGALRVAAELRSRELTAHAPIELVRLSGAELPFRDRAVDLAVSTNTLHHLPDREASEMLAQMARVARLGLVVVDLRRSRLAYAGTRLLANTVWRNNPFPRHDGPRSVLRAFTPAEAAGLLVDAGLEQGRVSAHPVWISLRWRRRAEARSRAPTPRRAWLATEVAVEPATAGP